MHVPAWARPVLTRCRPAGSPPTSHRWRLLALAAVLPTGRRPVTTRLRTVPVQAPGHASSSHRVVAQRRGSAWARARAWITCLLALWSRRGRGSWGATSPSLTPQAPTCVARAGIVLGCGRLLAVRPLAGAIQGGPVQTCEGPMRHAALGPPRLGGLGPAPRRGIVCTGGARSRQPSGRGCGWHACGAGCRARARAPAPHEGTAAPHRAEPHGPARGRGRPGPAPWPRGGVVGGKPPRSRDRHGHGALGPSCGRARRRPRALWA
jgi:hypothetical protein